MRKRWWVAGGVVVALVGGGAYGLVPALRDDYASGHAAYLRADCAAALPKLNAARDGDLGPRITALARTEVAACEKYAPVQTIGRSRPPAAAIPTYLTYLKGNPPEPLKNDARQQVRTALRADIDTGRADANFCKNRQIFTDPQVVELKPADELAASWLAACATTLAAEPGGWENARRTLLELQAEFPKSKEARATLADLVYVSTLAAAVYPDAKPITGFVPIGRDDTLNGRAQLMFYSQLTTPVDLTVAGPPPQYEHLPACEDCEGSPESNICRPKPSWKKTMITVSAGRHAFQLWAPASDRKKYWDTVGHGLLRFEPNRVYLWCVWE